jgi:predicted transposase/invertase (TIGR01784 family)
MAPTMEELSLNVFLNPLTDFGFKKVFLDKKLLIAFLNDVMALSIVDINYLPAEQLGDVKKERRAIFDLYCITENKEHFIVEMQKGRQRYFSDRALFYVSYPIRSQAPRGEEWNYKLNPVYLLSILDLILFDDKESENDVIDKVYLMRERAKTRFSEKLNFVFIELPKFSKKLDELETNTDRWLYCLKHLSEMETRPPQITGEAFERLFELAKIEKLTSKEMKAYKESILAYSDVRDIVEYARDENLAKGRAEGRAEGKWEETVQVIMNGHEAGFSLEAIALYTKLTVEEVSEIIASHS